MPALIGGLPEAAGMSSLNLLQHKLAGMGLESFLVTDLDNIRYLCGFSGSSAWLLVGQNQATLLTDFRYTTQAQQETSGIAIQEASKPLDWLSQNLKKLKPGQLGFEAEHISYQAYNKLRHAAGKIKLIPLTGQVEGLRLCKRPDEIECIRQAIKIASGAYDAVFGDWAADVAEMELAARLEFEMRHRGAEKIAFEPIVISGQRSALPHGRASEKIIRQRELVIIDFGAVWQGYNCDMTRTVMLGKPEFKQREIYNVVYDAQRQAIETAKPGITAGDLDKAARQVIEKAGYGEFFGHSTGHGVGLAVHEEPRLSPDNTTLLAPGMVFTVEPGIYLPELGGVRIEDMVLITENGHEVLTSRLPKSLL